ncbi:hypothetical protein JOB18_009176 [Solea senegalensis]|nr:tectonic-3-like [Solea senegalensis]KAG7506568.1 hypothetical protein JOB18_009176 [Solea senegalensis]
MITSRQWCRLFSLGCIAFCVCLLGAVSASSSNSTVSPTTEGEANVVEEATVAVEGEATVAPTENGPPVEAVTEEVPTESPATSASTVQPPVLPPQGCLCDLTPHTCDIGCCCDTVDCGVANLSAVFTGCPQKAVSGVCIEKWLMFRANVDSSLVTVTDSMFCVQSEDKAAQSFQGFPPSPALGDSYHFSPPAPISSSHSRPFYRVDDVIQTFMASSSVHSLLRQPSPGPAAGLCVSRNPAKFLRSVSLSCSRMVTPQSCTTDPTLNTHSYFSDLNLLKIPADETTQISDLLISVTPRSTWSAPAQQNDSCVNVVKHVELTIGYTVRGELTTATVNMVLADVDTNQLVQQTHSVQYKLFTPRSTPRGLAPTDGLRVGSPVIGRFDRNVTTVTTAMMSQGGECSSDSSRRAPILFTHNTISGCTFSSPSSSCSELRSQIYGILQGLAPPNELAMNSGSQPNWTRVITQDCRVSPQESCATGCLLPSSLSIQVLWARQGLVDLPQNYVLGAKYIFKCQNLKCPLSSRLALTTEVMFADTTVYPESPRGSPQPDWKFPFGFFTRGAAELDRHIVNNKACDAEVTWSLMLFTLMSLTGLQFSTR